MIWVSAGVVRSTTMSFFSGPPSFATFGLTTTLPGWPTSFWPMLLAVTKSSGGRGSTDAILRKLISWTL